MSLLELWHARDAIDERLRDLCDGCAEHAEGRTRQDLLLAAIDERAVIDRAIQRIYSRDFAAVHVLSGVIQ